jgi:hypothetical protein
MSRVPLAISPPVTMSVVIIEPDTVIDLARAWIPGTLYELLADVAGVLCDDPQVSAVASILKCGIITEQTWAPSSDGKLRAVLRATATVGHLALTCPMQDGPVVAIFLPLSVDPVTRHMFQLAGQWVPRFRLMRVPKWSMAEVYMRDTSLVSCGYWALMRSVHRNPLPAGLELDRVEVADFLLDRYMLDAAPDIVLMDGRFDPVCRLVLSTTRDKSTLPKGMIPVLRSVAQSPDVSIIRADGTAFRQSDVSGGLPACIQKTKKERPLHGPSDASEYCVLVYPRMYHVNEPNHDDCVFCRDSLIRPRKHDLCVKCVACDKTFRTYYRAKEHHATAHMSVE